MTLPVAEPLIVLSGIGQCAVSGGQSRDILSGIDLTLYQGEMIAVVGASGSGKSSLLNIIGGLDAPTQGVYRFDGQDVRSLTPAQRARLRGDHLGFVFQRYFLIPYLRVVDNVAMPGIYAGTKRPQRLAAAVDLLDALGLAEYAQRTPNQLSGGQQQRVSIARALLNRPRVILADEPTGALDRASRDSVMQVLHDLHRRGHTVVIVTHDMDVAGHAQRIIELRNGHVVADRANLRRPAHVPEAGRQCAAHPRHDKGGRWFDLAEALASACQALLSNRMRSLLLVGAVALSIAAAVSMVAIADGAQRYVMKDIVTIAPNIIELFRGFDWGDSRNDSINTLVHDDLIAIQRQPYVDSASPGTSRTLAIRYRSVTADATVSGAAPEFFRVLGLAIGQGRGFGLNEVLRQSQVAVIDRNTWRRFFGFRQDPIGKVILVGNTPVTVIGVLASHPVLDRSRSLYIWLPFTTAGSKVFGETSFDSISVRLHADQRAEDAERRLDKLLRQRHRGKDFFTFNADGLRKVTERSARSLSLLLMGIGAGVLFIGCAGVTNVMLVTVRERTVEIGIRMAAGANRWQIALQHGAESIIVCLLGGALGTLGAYSFISVLSWFVGEWNLRLDPALIVIAFACSALVGIVSAGFPARRAAKLDPAAALARD